ncbi:MAG: hypothetical protein IPJ26_17480 [Bacteroidetes bacterium]|nr:hypothetical protein [Bacteroidota bacterium]
MIQFQCPMFGLVSSGLPYFTDFESVKEDGYPIKQLNKLGIWTTRLGALSNSAHSGINCWDINLTTPSLV